jgi:tetratricopeptide (TPR) repeat protein
MSLFASKSALSASDRVLRRRLIFSDSLSLVTLFGITALLAVLTNYLYQSYASHQVKLADRWLQRGVQAMKENKPQAAIDALSSALAYSPGDRNTEIQLAEALASAGRTQEATVYFNNLLETQQGNGLINLQLARLAARQGNENQAIDDYQKSIYGSWEGDGYVRRREVRLELVNYLLAHNRLDQARNELLVASGNAPADDISIQLEVARMLEQAQAPGDALHIYKALLHRHPSLRDALEGAGRTAFKMGRYLEAKHYLSHALEGPGIEEEPAADVQQVRDMLGDATRLLQLYPSPRLTPRERSARILNDRTLAMARLSQCVQEKSSAPEPNVAAGGPTPAPRKGLPNPLAGLASRFTLHPSGTADKKQQAAAPPVTDPLEDLQKRWQELPVRLTALQLEQDPDLEQAQVQLIYDTELLTQQVCGAPQGDDALLFKIAQAPSQVEED